MTLLTRIYAHRILSEMAENMVKVFLPILILERTNSITLCFAYLLTQYTVQSFLNATCSRWTTAHTKTSFLLRAIPTLATYGLLLLDTTGYPLIVGLALSTALSSALYWVPLNHMFTRATYKSVGFHAGLFTGSAIVGKIIAPLASGVLLTFGGTPGLCLFAAILYAASLLVLLGAHTQTVDSLVAPEPAEQGELGNSAPVLLPAFVFAYLLVGVLDTSDLFWALHVYRESLEYVTVGGVVTFVNLGIFAANAFAGGLYDRNRWFTIALLACVLYGGVWLVRTFSSSMLSFYLTSILAGLLRPFFIVPSFSTFLTSAKKSGALLRWIWIREVAIKAGGALVVVLLWLFLAGTIRYAFPLAALASLAMLGFLVHLGSAKR